MVDLTDSTYWKQHQAFDKFLTYKGIKARCNNDPRKKEALEAEIDDKLLSTIDEFCKDKEPEEMAERIEWIQDYIGRNFNKSKKFVIELNNQMITHYNDNLPTTSTINAKEQAFTILEEAMSKLYTNCKLYKYGSSANGLSNNNSDLDITIILPIVPSITNISSLFEVQAYLIKNVPQVKSAETIGVRFPILCLKVQTDTKIVEVDMSIQNHKTVLNSYVLRQYSKIDSRLPILISVIKSWAKNNYLFGGANNRFNSYALALLVIQYLQSGVKPAILPYLNLYFPELFVNDVNVNDFCLDDDLDFEFKCRNKMTLFELLAGFMLYYKEFEFEKYQPSILSGTLANRFNRPNYFFSNPICMIDPLFGHNPCRVVGFATLMQFREALTRFKKICHPANKNIVKEFKIIFGLNHEDTSKRQDEITNTDLILENKFNWLLIW